MNVTVRDIVAGLRALNFVVFAIVPDIRVEASDAMLVCARTTELLGLDDRKRSGAQSWRNARPGARVA